MLNQPLEVSLLAHDRTLVYYANDVRKNSSDTCAVSAGNIEQLWKFRDLKSTSTPLTALRHRSLESSTIEVALGRADGVVELCRKSNSEWKTQLSLPISDTSIRCIEFLDGKLESGDRDRVSDDQFSHLIVVTSDRISLLTIPKDGNVCENSSKTRRLTFDLFYQASVKQASISIVSSEHFIVCYEEDSKNSSNGDNYELKVAHLRIELDDTRPASYVPKRIQLIEQFVLPIAVSPAKNQKICQIIFAGRDDRPFSDLVVVTNGVKVLRYEVTAMENRNLNNSSLQYALASSYEWEVETKGVNCYVATNQFTSYDLENSTSGQKRTFTAVSNGSSVLLLVNDGANMTKLAEIKNLATDSCFMVIQFESGSLDCAATLVRQSRTGVLVRRVAFLEFIIPERESRQRHYSNALSSFLNSRAVSAAEANSTSWPSPSGSLAELMHVSARCQADGELLRYAIDEALARFFDSAAPKIGTAAYFKATRLLFAKIGLDASQSPSMALEVWLFVQLVQMHALLIRVATVACQFEANNTEASNGAEKPPTTSPPFNVAQLIHEAASQNVSVFRLFEVVDNAVHALQNASVPPVLSRRGGLEEQQEQADVKSKDIKNAADFPVTATDLQFAIRFIRYFTLMLVENAVSSTRTHVDLRLVSLPLHGDKIVLQFLRECVTCVHLLATYTTSGKVGKKRNILAEQEHYVFDSVCDALSLLSATQVENMGDRDRIAMPAKFRAELLSIRCELRDVQFTGWLNANLVCFTSILRHANSSSPNDAETSDLNGWIDVLRTEELKETGESQAKRQCVRAANEIERVQSAAVAQWDAVWCKPLRDVCGLKSCSCCGAVTVRIRDSSNFGKLSSIWSVRCTRSCPLCDGRWVLE